MHHRLFSRLMAFVLPCLALCTGPAGAAEGSLAGMVKRVSGTATLERAGNSTPIQPGTTLNVGDRIVTASPGGVGLVLIDDTILTTGPGSRLVLNEVRFDSTTHEGSVFLRLLKGALHVVTGLVGRQSPQNVRIETPTAVMGVRGTEFIVDTEGGAP